MDSPKAQIEDFNPGWRLKAAWGSICIVNLACALDATTVSVAIPVISASIHCTSIEALWIGTAFLLASTVFQPSFNALSNDFGRKPVLLVALTLFTIGAILCGVAQASTMMLVGRTVQGAGVAGILTLTSALITDLIPLRHRGNYFALMSIVWAVGTIAGPLVGGVLAQEGAYRWIFWINLPIVALGFIGVLFFLHLNQPVRSLKQIITETDWIGSVLFIASMTAFLIPISWGGVIYAWSSWRTLVPMILGICGLVAFCFYEEIFAKHPVIPIRIFRNSSTNLTYVIDVLQGLILLSIIYYMPLYFMACKSYTPIIAGVAALPQTLTVVPSAGIVGMIATKTGHYRWSIWAGWVLNTLGTGLLYLLGPATSTVAWIFLLLVSGIGTGLLFPGMNLSVQASVANKDMSTAAGMFSFFRALGQCLGVALGGVIFQNRLAIELQPFPQFAIYSQDAVSLIAQMDRLPPHAAETILLKAAFANAIKTVWAAMCGIAGISLLISLFIKEFSLDRVHETAQGFVEGKTEREKMGDNVEEGVVVSDSGPGGENNSKEFMDRGGKESL